MLIPLGQNGQAICNQKGARVMMSKIQAEAGSTYSFDVEDFFTLPDGSITFLGVPSHDFENLFPALATILVDGQEVGHAHITDEKRHVRPLEHARPVKRSIATFDKIDLTPYKDKAMLLHCTIGKHSA